MSKAPKAPKTPVALNALNAVIASADDRALAIQELVERGLTPHEAAAVIHLILSPTSTFSALARAAGVAAAAPTDVCRAGKNLAKNPNVTATVRELLSRHQRGTPEGATEKLVELVDCGHFPTELRATERVMALIGLKEEASSGVSVDELMASAKSGLDALQRLSRAIPITVMATASDDPRITNP